MDDFHTDSMHAPPPPMASTRWAAFTHAVVRHKWAVGVGTAAVLVAIVVVIVVMVHGRSKTKEQQSLCASASSDQNDEMQKCLTASGNKMCGEPGENGTCEFSQDHSVHFKCNPDKSGDMCKDPCPGSTTSDGYSNSQFSKPGQDATCQCNGHFLNMTECTGKCQPDYYGPYCNIKKQDDGWNMAPPSSSDGNIILRAPVPVGFGAMRYAYLLALSDHKVWLDGKQSAATPLSVQDCNTSGSHVALIASSTSTQLWVNPPQTAASLEQVVVAQTKDAICELDVKGYGESVFTLKPVKHGFHIVPLDSNGNEKHPLRQLGTWCIAWGRNTIANLPGSKCSAEVFSDGGTCGCLEPGGDALAFQWKRAP